MCCALSCCLLLYRTDVRADTLSVQGVCSSLECWPPAVALLQGPSSSPLEAHQPQLGHQGQTSSCRSSSRSKRGQDGDVGLSGGPAGAVSVSLQRWRWCLHSLCGMHECAAVSLQHQRSNSAANCCLVTWRRACTLRLCKCQQQEDSGVEGVRHSTTERRWYLMVLCCAVRRRAEGRVAAAAERRHQRKEEKELLDELLPRATGGTREARVSSTAQPVPPDSLCGAMCRHAQFRLDLKSLSS